MAKAIPNSGGVQGPLGPFFISRNPTEESRATTAHPEQAMSDKSHDPNQMTGAAMIVRARIDHGVKHLFGYPGGAVLPTYDEIFQQTEVEHILVRHEQGAGHAAQGYARSTGKPGVVLVTSGPGATNLMTLLTGASVINAGREASKLLRDLVAATGVAITSTLMGLGAYPASGRNGLGMLGMHGTYEANMAMHDCDVMLCVGARFDDRITGRVDAFSPGSKKIHIDIDPSSINKNIRVDVPIIGDAGNILGDMLQVFKAEAKKPDIKSWWQEIATWRARNSLSYRKSNDVILPQHAIQNLFEATRGHDTYITTEVGQHQMWAAQFFGFEEPHRWMTSGGLGTMRYGLLPDDTLRQGA